MQQKVTNKNEKNYSKYFYIFVKNISNAPVRKFPPTERYSKNNMFPKLLGIGPVKKFSLKSICTNALDQILFGIIPVNKLWLRETKL